MSGVYFLMPLELSVEEQTAILDYAALLQQGSSDFTWSPFTLTLYRKEQGLDTLANESPVEVSWVQDEVLDLRVGSIPIGQIRYRLNSARVADPEQIRRGSENGSGVDVEIVPGHSNRGLRKVVR